MGAVPQLFGHFLGICPGTAVCFVTFSSKVYNAKNSDRGSLFEIAKSVEQLVAVHTPLVGRQGASNCKAFRIVEVNASSLKGLI